MNMSKGEQLEIFSVIYYLVCHQNRIYLNTHYLCCLHYFLLKLNFYSNWYTINLTARVKPEENKKVDPLTGYSSKRNFRNVKRRTFSCFWQMRNQFFQVIAYSKCQGITTKL